LPELAKVLQVAEANAGKVYTDSDMPESFSKALAEICPCSSCSICPTPGETLFCLHRIGATIFHFLWILSWLDIDPSVKPSSTGLLMLYYTASYGCEYPKFLWERLWQHGLNTSLVTLFTGSVYDEKTSAGTSAISDSGICIYFASLKDPNVGPFQLLQHRVTLGHTERNGFTYRKVSDKSRDRGKTDPEDDLSSFVSRLGPATELQLVVEETLNPRIIEASFYINTQFIPPQRVGNFVYGHPLRVYMNELRPTPHGAHFGAAEMRTIAMRQMKAAHCSKDQIDIISSKSLKQTTSWTGECSLAVSALWTGPAGVIECVPQQREWLLSESLNNGTNILRGSYANFLFHPLPSRCSIFDQPNLHGSMFHMFDPIQCQTSCFQFLPSHQ
jgi:hypothetical protein